MFVVGKSTSISVDKHNTIADIIASHLCTVRTVDRDQFVVSTKTVAVSVWVVKKATLKHLVSTWFNAWYEMGG